MKYVSSRQINLRSFTGRDWREYRLLKRLEYASYQVANCQRFGDNYTWGWGAHEDPRLGLPHWFEQLDEAVAACVAFDREELIRGHCLVSVLKELLTEHALILDKTI